MGGMGYSFGAGIGMAFGRAMSNGPSRRTVVIAGDGAFFMHGMEVHTAVQYQLPVTFVLFNNNAHAMCVTREQLFYDDLYSYNRFAPASWGPVWRACSRLSRSTWPTSTHYPQHWNGQSLSTVRPWSPSSAPQTKSHHSRQSLNRQPANQVVEQHITTLRENRIPCP